MLPLKLEIVPDRMAIRADETSELDILIDIQAQIDQPGAVTQAGPMSLAISLDRSGSMGAEKKLEKAKSTIKSIISRTSKDDKIALIAFNNEAEVISSITSAHDDTYEKVDAVHATGGTNIVLGWYLSLLELQKVESDIKHIILISDGQANAGIIKITEVRSEAAKAADIGITTSAIGVGTDCDQDFLETLTYGSGGRFFYAESGDLDEILEEEFGTSKAIVVPRPFLAFEIPAGVTVVKEFHTFRRIADRLRIPPISLGEKQCLALRLNCDPDIISGSSVSLVVHLYAGQTRLISSNIDVPILSFEDYVEAEIAPLVGAFVQTFLSRKNDEKFEQAADKGDFALAQTIVLEEINGLRLARDKLDISSERSYHEHDRMSFDVCQKTLTYVLNDLQILFSRKNIPTLHRQNFDHLYIKCRKLLKGGMSRNSSRRRLNTHDSNYLISALEEVRNLLVELEKSNLTDASLQQYMDAVNGALEDISRIDMGRH